MRIRGQLSFPGDKSISHRALLLGALANGKSTVRNCATGRDVRSTLTGLQACGIRFEQNTASLSIHPRPLHKPARPVDCGNSGTTARLLLGLLAGQTVGATLVGDASLSGRPMGRVIEPLRKMGARLEGTRNHLPLTLREARLTGIEYELPVASAQVKSALLLAGLGADGTTVIIEKIPTRNHTEIMLEYLGAPLQAAGRRLSVQHLLQPLDPVDMTIPGDPSTAAFFAAAAILVPGSVLILDNILANPTRTGFYRILEQMGASLEWVDNREEQGEKTGTLRVTGQVLHGVSLSGEAVPAMIDEIPILAILATQAAGITEIRGAGELRVKESDRLKAICRNLTVLGADIEAQKDGFIISGPTELRGGRVRSYGDHRIAMAFTIAGLISKAPVRVDDSSCVDVSCPEFYSLLTRIVQ